MNLQLKTKSKGFTIVELMIAISITALLIIILVSLTTMTTGVLQSADSKVKASNQAKILFDKLESDINSMVIRSDDQEWFYAGLGNTMDFGTTQLQIKPSVATNRRVSAASDLGDFSMPNCAYLVFLTAAQDRYDGLIGTSEDKGGDISMVEYWSWFSNITASTGDAVSTDTDSEAKQLSIARLYISPNEAFLSGTNADQSKNTVIPINSANCMFRTCNESIKRQNQALTLDYQLSGGLYQFSCIFNVSYTEGGVRKIQPIILRPLLTVDSTLVPSGTDEKNIATFLRISGPRGVIANAPSLWESDNTLGGEEKYGDYFKHKTGISNSKVESVEIIATFLNEEGQRYLNILDDGGTAYMTRSELIDKHGRTFSRTINFPEY